MKNKQILVYYVEVGHLNSYTQQEIDYYVHNRTELQSLEDEYHIIYVPTIKGSSRVECMPFGTINK